MGRRSPGKGGSKRRRVDFRRNRSRPARQKQWVVPDEHDELAEDTIARESVQGKGSLSRRRTVIEGQHTWTGRGRLQIEGTAVAVRGRFVEVDDGERLWPCTIRRVLRTRRIRERSPVVVGDRVVVSIVADEDGVLQEGVIEQVLPRRSSLTRSDGRRTQVLAANIDQVLIVMSIREPSLKPHLLDRYLVAAHAGHLQAVICFNKVDLASEDAVSGIRDLYARLGYSTLVTSSVTGQGVDALRSVLHGKATLLAGQSGVGKSSLLNAVQPGLNLRTATVSSYNEKGRHTTTTAVWLKLAEGGAVVDTPGIRALDIAMVPLNELEMHFVEFVDRLSDCKFPDCTHIHEDHCAICEAVESGAIDEARYESYVMLFEELSSGEFYEARWE